MWPVPTSTANRMPHSEPPAMSPELNSVPAPISDSSCTPGLRSTNARTRPPAKTRADDVARRQILRRAAGVRGRDADDGAYAECDRRVRITGPPEPDEQ